MIYRRIRISCRSNDTLSKTKKRIERYREESAPLLILRRDVFHASIRDGLDKGKAEAAGFEAAGRPGDGYIHITGESP